MGKSGGDRNLQSPPPINDLYVLLSEIANDNLKSMVYRYSHSKKVGIRGSDRYSQVNRYSSDR